MYTTICTSPQTIARVRVPKTQSDTFGGSGDSGFPPTPSNNRTKRAHPRAAEILVKKSDVGVLLDGNKDDITW